ncbi:hypothetical protein [Marinobacter similis]|nr:hypothetical protein [Marinobacter similis]
MVIKIRDYNFSGLTGLYWLVVGIQKLHVYMRQIQVHSSMVFAFTGD